MELKSLACGALRERGTLRLDREGIKSEETVD